MSENKRSKYVFLIEEFVQYDPPHFEARLDPMNRDTSGLMMPNDPGKSVTDFASSGATPLEAIKSLTEYLTKTDHSDEIWMA